MQSIEAKEADIRTNGDGFGIGWYTPEINTSPGLYTSTLPAWNDLNLISLCQKIKSPCFFAHVRAANQGEVTQLNCHPFISNEWMFMHNGLVGNFDELKREIQNLLDDQLFRGLKGSTDSEHIFALVLQHLKKEPKPASCKGMANALRNTIKLLSELAAKTKVPESSFLNLCLTDGKKMVACRYTNDENDPARSLYYTSGGQVQIENGQCQLSKPSTKKCVMITSEKLTETQIEWHPITNHELILVEENHDIHFEAI
jgi:glutamine amidotransferase